MCVLTLTKERERGDPAQPNENREERAKSRLNSSEIPVFGIPSRHGAISLTSQSPSISLRYT